MNPKDPSVPGQTRLRRLPLPVLLGAMLIAGLCALLALNTASAAEELKQRNLADANANASDSEQQLLRDLAAKQAPAALAAEAAQLGLVPNPNPAFLRINANGSVTVLGSAVPASSAPVAAPPSPVAPPPTSTAKRTTSPSTSTSKSPAKSSPAKPTASPSRTASSSKTPAKPTSSATTSPGGHR